jgi:hypothetical protein
MTGGLNSVVRALTGPRRLRSALRQQTAAINSLLVALDGPAELRVTIPASVFGGDIFGVMSSQLREALIVPPPSQVTLAKPERRRSFAKPASATLNNQSDPFQPISEWLKPSTQWANSYHEPTARTSPTETERRSDERAVPLRTPQERGISRKGIDASLVGETSVSAMKPSVNSLGSSTIRPLRATAALVSSLNRYWQHSRETHSTARADQPVTALDLSNDSRNLAAPGVEQQTTSRGWANASEWSNSLAQDVFKRRSILNESARGSSGRSPRSARFDFADPTVHPDFNFHRPTNHESHYDDLGDRLAQVLHEQALQHGIDVT